MKISKGDLYRVRRREWVAWVEGDKFTSWRLFAGKSFGSSCEASCWKLDFDCLKRMLACVARLLVIGSRDL